MNPKTIGIIGIEGSYGQWLERFFKGLGHTVIGSDPESENTDNRATVDEAEVIVFAVPIQVTAQVIRDVVPVSRADQLWLDITSLKKDSIDAMLESKAAVVGLHPMCAPTVDTWKGQIVIFCPVRPREWLGWILDILQSSQADIQPLEPDDHDLLMAFIQALPHAGNLVMAAVLREMHVDMNQCRKYTSSFYRLAWSSMARTLSMNAELCTDIQMLNKENTLEMVKRIETEAQRLGEIIRADDRDGFLEQFNASSEHFGTYNLQDGDKLFDRLIRVTADLSQANLIELESGEDRPGLLHQISGILEECEINMTSLHSFPSEQGYRFIIGVEDRRDSPRVQAAVLRIESEIDSVEILP